MAADADITDPRISKSAQVLPLKAVASVPYVDFRTLAAALAFMGDVYTGDFVGTGADLDVALPFDPAAVFLLNETTLATQLYLPGMAAANSYQRASTGVLTLVAANGLTMGAKGERKFTAGSAVQAAADAVKFVALGTRGVGGST